VLDEAPFDTSPLKEQWSSKHPKAKMVTVLITKKMASYLAESFGSASEDPLGTLNADEITIGVLPLVIEDVEMPAIFSSLISVSIIDKKPSIVADYIERHLFSGFAQSLHLIKKQMAFLSFLCLVVSIGLFMMLNSDLLVIEEDSIYVEMVTPLFVISLGILGSVSYILFNIIGIVSEEAFDVEDSQSNYLRIILGAITGWIFYIFLTHSGYGTELEPKQFLGVAVGIAFLSGFSSKLFIGIINQAIKAVERTVGIEQKFPEKKSTVKSQ